MSHTATEEMNRLIQDPLEVSGMEAGNVAVEPRPERAELLVRGACAGLAHAAEARSIGWS